MSNMTKRMLSASLKKLLSQKTLDNITIQDITDDAEVSRKTFYYHFQDIYDLLNYTLTEDTRRLLNTEVTRDNWVDCLRKLLVYSQKERMVVLNTFHSIQRSTLEAEFTRWLSPIITSLLASQPGSERIPGEDKDFLINIFSYGLCGMILRWIGEGMTGDIEKMLSLIERFFSGSLEDLVRRYTRTAP